MASGQRGSVAGQQQQQMLGDSSSAGLLRAVSSPVRSPREAWQQVQRGPPLVMQQPQHGSCWIAPAAMQLVVHSSSAAGGTTPASAVLFALHWRPVLRPAQNRAAASAAAQPRGAAGWAGTPRISRLRASSRSNGSEAHEEDKCTNVNAPSAESQRGSKGWLWTPML